MKNAIRQFSLPGYDTTDYIAESIAFLRDNEPPEGFFLGFSGGKDSIVLLKLCRVPFHPQFISGGHTTTQRINATLAGNMESI